MRNNKYPVKSLIKALNILEYLGTVESGSTLTEISAKLRFGKSTVHRLLATLQDRDFVWFDPHSSRYILGARILQLSEQLSHQSILVRYGEPLLERLAQVTGETCNLGVLDGDKVLYLIMKESRNPLRMAGQRGKRLPAHCTALGKAILSGLSREELMQIYDEKQVFENSTSNSISTLAGLIEELENVRLKGLAFDNEELYPGVVCLGAPVRDQRGETVAAVSISLPKNRIDPEGLGDFRSLLLQCAMDLSRELGYQGAPVGEGTVEQLSR